MAELTEVIGDAVMRWGLEPLVEEQEEEEEEVVGGEMES